MDHAALITLAGSSSGLLALDSGAWDRLCSVSWGSSVLWGALNAFFLAPLALTPGKLHIASHLSEGISPWRTERTGRPRSNHYAIHTSGLSVDHLSIVFIILVYPQR